MKDYFEKPENLGRTVAEFTQRLKVDPSRVRIRVRTLDGETIDAIGFEAEDEWVQFATSDETIRVIPWQSLLDLEIYVAADTAHPPTGFRAPAPD